MSKVWITADGEMIPISDMEDDHLEKCISLIENSAEYKKGGTKLKDRVVALYPDLKEEKKLRNLKKNIYNKI